MIRIPLINMHQSATAYELLTQFGVEIKADLGSRWMALLGVVALKLSLS